MEGHDECGQFVFRYVLWLVQEEGQGSVGLACCLARDLKEGL